MTWISEMRSTVRVRGGQNGVVQKKKKRKGRTQKPQDLDTGLILFHGIEHKQLSCEKKLAAWLMRLLGFARRQSAACRFEMTTFQQFSLRSSVLNCPLLSFHTFTARTNLSSILSALHFSPWCWNSPHGFLFLLLSWGFSGSSNLQQWEKITPEK